MIIHLLQACLRLYRMTIGKILPRACRFTPTCSRYAAEAIGHRGPIVGSAMTLWRILRCNPFCAGGYDPAVRSCRPCEIKNRRSGKPQN
ncbi:MAG: membrane protein insertion efficiency factor YidD [Planctomycetota bacterium]|nr:membrane protein insertion efficiency factor YidD [Planctomycetota bacterium]